MLKTPVFGGHIATGFPSPADDFVEQKLDLNQYLIAHREATFFLTVEGDSMIGAGIHDGDLIIVDRSLPACHNKIVVAVINGELTIRRLSLKNNKAKLVAENANYQVVNVADEQSLQIWGVVTSVIHKL